MRVAHADVVHPAFFIGIGSGIVLPARRVGLSLTATAQEEEDRNEDDGEKEKTAEDSAGWRESEG